MEYRLMLMRPDDPSDEIRDDPETYYRRARELARRLAHEQLKEEARGWANGSRAEEKPYATA